jgi:hypothetical protein
MKTRVKRREARQGRTCEERVPKTKEAKSTAAGPSNASLSAVRKRE